MTLPSLHRYLGGHSVALFVLLPQNAASALGVIPAYTTVTNGCPCSAAAASSIKVKAHSSYSRSSSDSLSYNIPRCFALGIRFAHSIARATCSTIVGVSCTKSPFGPCSVKQCSYSPRSGYGPNAGTLAPFALSTVFAYHSRGDPYVSGGTQRSTCQRFTCGYFGSSRNSTTSRTKSPCASRSSNFPPIHANRFQPQITR